MHAVIVKVKIGDFDKARKGLREEVVPRASQAPGFVAGYWTRSDDGHSGLSMILFESEANARAAEDQISSGKGVLAETVTLESVEVREVAEHA